MQSATFLNRDFYVNSFVELIKQFDIVSNSILKMIKSLYEISKANNHWFVTYLSHHDNKLEMIQSIYDSCLFHINMNDSSLDSHLNLVQIDLKNDRNIFSFEKKCFFFVRLNERSNRSSNERHSDTRRSEICRCEEKSDRWS